MAGWGRVARYGEVLRGGTGSRAVGRAWSGCGGAPLQRARAGRAAGALRARCSAPARRQLLAAGGAPGLAWGRRRRHGRSRPSQHAHAPTSWPRGSPRAERGRSNAQARVLCDPARRALSTSTSYGALGIGAFSELLQPDWHRLIRPPRGTRCTCSVQRSARTPCTFFSRAAAHRYAPLRTPCSCPSRAGADRCPPPRTPCT